MADDDFFRKRIVYEVPGMSGIEARRDIVYGSAADGDLTMDVYLPPGLGADERRPGVLFVHGGPVPAAVWPGVKDWGVFISYGQLLAASGFVAVAFNHRYLDLRELAASWSNVAAALAFIRDQASAFHLDGDRLAVWVFSGGGPLIAPLLRDRPPHVRALVAYYAALDLASARGKTTQTIISDEAARDFSPAGCFPDDGAYDGPPILVARAGKDSALLNGTIDLFVQRALAANAPLDLMNHPAGRHGFDILDDDNRSREIIARTVEFLKSHL